MTNATHIEKDIAFCIDVLDLDDHQIGEMLRWCEKLIVDLIYEGGIANMNYSISNTAEYGEYVSGKKIINNDTKKRMKEILGDIQSGKFAKQWMDECKNGQKNFLKMRKDLSNHPIEQVGEKLRALMPWIGKNKLIDKDKN